ncbi:PepSY domain-containing protein [Pseudomonadota bacterium]
MRQFKILLISICLTCLPGIMLAGDKDDHLKARQLVQEGTILPLEQIIERTRSQHPGRILEVEFEQEHDRYVYEIELVDEQGQVWELEYDAATGELIEKEQEK